MMANIMSGKYHICDAAGQNQPFNGISQATVVPLTGHLECYHESYIFLRINDDKGTYDSEEILFEKQIGQIPDS